MANEPTSATHDPVDTVAAQQRLVDIDQEVGLLAPDAFAKRVALSDEADTLRKALLHTSPEAVAEAQAKWAERAGHKGEHEIDPEIAKAVAVSKGMGAGHAGGG